MLEYPEIITIIKQMNKEIIGKTVESGALVKHNSNMFMGEGGGHADQYSLLRGGTVVSIESLAPDFYIRLDNGYGILIRQSGGKIIFNKTAADIPKNHNIIFTFTDGSSLTYTMSLFTLGFFAASHKEWEGRKRSNILFDPLGENTYDDYAQFIATREGTDKTAIKLFLTKNVLGIGSSFASEILLYAKIYPSTQMGKLSPEDHKRVYDSMKRVLTAACDSGGRTGEYDLYGKKGTYIAMGERKHIGEPCPNCGNTLEKATVGGVAAFCPTCQVKAKR